jgi:hypothetical protein
VFPEIKKKMFHRAKKLFALLPAARVDKAWLSTS